MSNMRKVNWLKEFRSTEAFSVIHIQIGTEVNKQEYYRVSFWLQPIWRQIKVCALKNIFEVTRKNKLGL